MGLSVPLSKNEDRRLYDEGFDVTCPDDIRRALPGGAPGPRSTAHGPRVWIDGQMEMAICEISLAQAFSVSNPVTPAALPI